MRPRPAESRNRVKVGRYLVTGRIGRGGMGMVYRAVDEALEREVALKTLISEDGLDSESRKRFQVEAKAAARLQHPNIVIVYELGEDRGIPFIAMELLPGCDLEALLRGGEPLSLVEKLEAVAQVCRGLAYAHERGIVHRDIKPSNIRLLEDGTAKIMDFGIAKLGGTQLTKAGMMVGTVHYMSPEQVRGKPLDGRSDVFSLGVILYELVAGQRPFRGEGPTQILFKIVHEAPPPLELSALGAAGPRIGAIVARALAKEPEARYATASAMADEIAAAVEELQCEQPAPPQAAVAALAGARQALRDGRAEESIAALRALIAEHPGLLEARRALRAAVAEQSRRSFTPAPGSDQYPELESTSEATRTKEGVSTELMETAVVVPEGGVPPQPRTEPAAAGSSRRLWAGAAAGTLLVIVAAAAVLIHAAKSPPSQAVRIPVRAEPTGVTVLVNGRASDLSDGQIEVPPPVPGRVELTFRKAGYREQRRTVDLPLQPGAAVAVRLEAVLPQLAVRTQPPGAAVTLDGQAAGISPLELPLTPDSEHRVAVSLDGYLSQEVRIGKGERRGLLELTLERLAPPGTVNVASAYPLEVLWRGRSLARGQSSPRVSVPGGRQTLTLVASAVFLRAEIPITVPPGGAVALEAPRLGRLSIRAMPDNCQVFVDGAFVDYPPILDRPAVEGRHLVSFRWPDGSRAEKEARVDATSPTFVVGQKE